MFKNDLKTNFITNQSSEHLCTATKIVESFRDKQKDSRYIGCFVFGSFATGDFHQFSDIDVVIVTADTANTEPYRIEEVDDVKVDISIETLDQVIEREEEILRKAERHTWLADCLILFDKTGQLGALKQKYDRLSQPQELSLEKLRDLKQYLLKVSQKIQQTSVLNQDNCEFVLFTSLKTVVDYYYKAHNKFTVQNKKLFSDLEIWSPDFAYLVKNFIQNQTLERRITCWLELESAVIQAIDQQIDNLVKNS
jgi:predicted nucleotidyltransferase